jgi:hypothetical protein
MNPKSISDEKKSKAFKDIMESKGKSRKVSMASVQSKESCEPGDKNCGVKSSSKKVDNFYKKKTKVTSPITDKKVPIYEDVEEEKTVTKEPKVRHTRQESGRSADEEEVITERIAESEYNKKIGSPIGRPVNSGLPGKTETKTTTKRKIVGWESKTINPKKSLVDKNSEKLKSRMKK